MIVVDASVMVEVLLFTPESSRAFRRIFSDGESLHAPYLLDIEVAHALRRYSLWKEIEPQRGRDALDNLRALMLTRHSHTALLPRIWELRHNVTAYDGAYLALAEMLAAPLLTCDRALASSSDHRAEVELV